MVELLHNNCRTGSAIIILCMCYHHDNCAHRMQYIYCTPFFNKALALAVAKVGNMYNRWSILSIEDRSFIVVVIGVAVYFLLANYYYATVSGLLLQTANQN